MARRLHFINHFMAVPSLHLRYHLNILFLHTSRHEGSPWRDGSTRYRCYHLAEALRRQGHIADVMSLAELKIDHLSRYSAVSVLRPHPSKTLDQLLKRCQRLGIRTLADVDDLVFVPRFSALSPSAINNQATEFSVRARFKRNLEAMLSFDEITVSTEPLAQHWSQETGKNQVTVIPNGLSSRWLQAPVQHSSSDQSEQKVITYLPGSNSHNKDFSEITEVLCNTMNTYKNVKLLIVGSLQIDERMFPATRLVRSRWVDYYKLPQIIASSTVTLAPLVSSPFTFAKSHIKFIESAAFGTPAICSPNHDICRHQSVGLHIADTAEEWHNALEKTLSDSLDSSDLKRMQSHIRNTETAERSADILFAQLEQIDSRVLLQSVGKL